MAVLAKEYDYVAPRFVEENVLSITEGVHPLLKVSNPNFIPNSIDSSKEKSRVRIVYGPNSSGKTIYLKQVALLAYLAQIGSFIPAKEARLGLLSHIHTRIFSSESIISECSSFMHELRNFGTMVSNCGDRSLLIMDEMGQGTTELSGIALVVSCVNHFSAGHTHRHYPHVIISTHLSNAPRYINNPSAVSIHMMEYTVENGLFTFLYRLQELEDTTSTTEDISVLCDIPDFIKATANNVLRAMRSGEDVTAYTEKRIQRAHSYYNFLKRFSKLDTRRKDFVENLRKKLNSIMI